jgi:hypothetical protein
MENIDISGISLHRRPKILISVEANFGGSAAPDLKLRSKIVYNLPFFSLS